MKYPQLFIAFTVFQIFPLAASLNILLSCTDSWVDKNARYLYPALIEAGHKVVFVGPLHANLVYYSEEKEHTQDFQKLQQNNEEGLETGEFGHLKEAHQKYFGYLRKLNVLARGAKKVISSKDSAKYDTETQTQNKNLVRNRAYGQDPLNPAFWYVNGSPLEALAVAFDVILSDHISKFSPDLVIIGPNEGLHLTCPKQNPAEQITVADLLTHPDQAEAMRLLAQIKKVPAISVSTEDADHIYFEDEDFFNVEKTKYKTMFKQNFATKNIQFVNLRLMELIDKAVPHLKPGQSLNANFPSMNKYLSTCLTNDKKGPNFTQVVGTTNKRNVLGHVFEVPTFTIRNGSVHLVKKVLYKTAETLSTPETMSDLEFLRFQKLLKLSVLEEESTFDQTYSDNEDMNTIICNAREYKVLEMCQIAVSVEDISRATGLDTSVFDLLRFV